MQSNYGNSDEDYKINTPECPQAQKQHQNTRYNSAKANIGSWKIQEAPRA